MIKRLFSSLFPNPAPGRFASAGILRQQISGSILVVGGGGWENAQRGVETDEEAINIRRLEVRYYLAVNEKLQNNVGEPRARAMTDKWSRDITMEGEAIGPSPYSIATAIDLANDTATIGDGSGDIFLDELTETQERGGWRSLSMKMSSDPNITAT